MDFIRREDIKKECTVSVTYERGMEMYKNGNVFSLKLKKLDAETVEMIASVDGSNREKTYRTTAKIRRVPGKQFYEICGGNCECKAYIQYAGICKHIVAVLLETNCQVDVEEVNDLLNCEADGTTMVIPGLASEKGERALLPLVKEGVLHKGMPEKPKKIPAVSDSGRAVRENSDRKDKKSSEELLDVIKDIVVQERSEVAHNNAYGDVKLELTLHIDENEEYLEFKVGKTRMFVVRSVRQFLYDVKNSALVMYGSSFGFAHRMNAFTDESQAIISMLFAAPKREKTGNYFRMRSGDKRYQTLDVRMVDEMMALFEGKEMQVVVPMLRRGVNLTMVKKEDPKLPVLISGMPSGGEAEVYFPPVAVLWGRRSMYIWSENVFYCCSEEYSKDMAPLMSLMAANSLPDEREEFAKTGPLVGRRRRRPLILNKDDYLSFCAVVLPVLEKWGTVKTEDIDINQYRPEKGVYELFLDIDAHRDIVCRGKASYGNKVHNLIKAPTMQEPYRDLKAEHMLRTEIKRYFPDKTEDGRGYLMHHENDELMAALVMEGVDRFRQLSQVFVSEAFRKLRIAKNTKIATGLSIHGNLLNVTWNIQGMTTDELYEILSAYRRKKKYYRLKDGELLDLEDDGIGVLSVMQENLHLTKTQLKAGMAEVPLYRAMYLNALMQENKQRLEITRDEMFSRWLQKMETPEQCETPVPEELQGTLRGYQVDGFHWACTLSEMGFGGILADDMGLGKTLQMIAYLCTRKGMVHLVVCPASLVYNWEAEFERFAPPIRVGLIVGTGPQRQKLLEQWQYYDVLVTSYDLLKRDIELYADKEFGCQIIDEAQYIKNPSTQAAKAVKAVHSRNRFALTGTPIENRISELWSIFEYLMPGYLYSYKYFKENFEQDILEQTQRADEAMTRLHQMIAPFLLRRLKRDVLQDLPDKEEKIVYTRFEEEQKKLYQATEKNILMQLKKNKKNGEEENKLQILAEMTKLRQICCDPALLYENYTSESAKLLTCMELVENALEGGHRILLFSQFTTMLSRIGRELSGRGIPYFELTGSTNKAKRQELVERFQHGEVPVFLISLKAGGTGLNLTAADMVIHYDPWWNIAAQNQATDRTHRIGQEKDVTVYKLIARDTIEERILKLQEQKKDLADQILSAEGASLASLTREEMEALLGL